MSKTIDHVRSVNTTPGYFDEPKIDLVVKYEGGGEMYYPAQADSCHEAYAKLEKILGHTVPCTQRKGGPHESTHDHSVRVGSEIKKREREEEERQRKLKMERENDPLHKLSYRVRHLEKENAQLRRTIQEFGKDNPPACE